MIASIMESVVTLTYCAADNAHGTVVRCKWNSRALLAGQHALHLSDTDEHNISSKIYNNNNNIYQRQYIVVLSFQIA